MVGPPTPSVKSLELFARTKTLVYMAPLLGDDAKPQHPSSNDKLPVLLPGASSSTLEAKVH